MICGAPPTGYSFAKAIHAARSRDGVAMTAPFDIQVSASDGIAVLAVSGDIDLAVVGQLRAKVSAQLDLERVNGVLIDLSAVTFMDSTGIGTLVGCWHQAEARGKTLQIANARSQIARVLDITGVLGLLSAAAPES
jgi:anti-sigma B factor antagonist